MKRFKEWWKENWENRSFRYGVTVMVIIVLAILTNIYVYFKDREVDFAVNETENAASYSETAEKLFVLYFDPV